MAQKNHSNGELFEKQDTALYGDGRQRQSLFVPRVLKNAAGDRWVRGESWQQAHEIIKKWAELDLSGKLRTKNETALEGEFLTEVFGQALGYTLFSKGLNHWNLEPKFSVNGGVADAALGVFIAAKRNPPAVLIELKGPTVNVDRDRSNGRTPVQQLWDYLDEQPACQWGIVCNYVSFRLYHRNHTPHTYQRFILRELIEDQNFAEFYHIFVRDGFLPPAVGLPRTEKLLAESLERQQTVGTELYNSYDEKRRELILFLQGTPHRKTLEQAIHISQKLIDRIIFVAFCEDRELLPAKSINSAYTNLPPFQKVTNPRWQNFIHLFEAIDSGNPRANIPKFNGRLFAKDIEVDDLQLDDSWTDFFNSIANYDFRDEVSVEVLGHLFEKSISDISRIRLGGLFDQKLEDGQQPKMAKSAERKRFGIYYTPPEFTDFISRSVVRRVALERFDELAKSKKVKRQDETGMKPDQARAAYWKGCLEILQALKVVDPACGSGAFLVSAYDVLDELYQMVLSYYDFHDGSKHEDLLEQIPEFILRDNLHGVDLSPQAVEIAQLSLWIRSAQRDKTLTDLSKNIVCGNSLISDTAISERALDWEIAFPKVFSRKERGFDCVIGNPPWERMKLQEREYFDIVDTRISTAVNAAERRKLINKLEEERPEIHNKYLEAKAEAEKNLDYVRSSGRYPLTGKGDINTYAVFAELASQVVSPSGRAGLLLPSGIATDDTTKDFFGSLVSGHRLSAVYDFENKAPIFPDVHRSFKFSAFLFGGSDLKNKELEFVFFAHKIDEVREKTRRVKLNEADIALVNPNTKTLPIFRSQRDAEITKGIYKRVPVLVDESRKEGGNPWGVKFSRMFDQTNDAELFRTVDDLKTDGFRRHGPIWKKGKTNFLPMYEAKMIQMYDHRAASVVVKDENWFRQGQTEDSTLVQHQNSEYFVNPRWWGDKDQIAKVLPSPIPPALLAFKNVTSPTNQRTMIAAFVPSVGVINSAPLILIGTEHGPRKYCCLLANFDSLALDYVARQKIGNVNLNFFLIEQFPAFSPEFYNDPCPWSRRASMEKWISERVLKLSCTSDDMIPLAEACEFDPPVHPWKPDERAELTAELDAAYFILYGIKRDDVEYILSTFQGIVKEEEGMFGASGTQARILKYYDQFRAKMAGR